MPLVSLSIRNLDDRRVSVHCTPHDTYWRLGNHYRVKSDALFSYQPPFNLLALAILWPLSFVVSPRTLHSANVFLIKLTVCICLCQHIVLLTTNSRSPSSS